MTPETLLSIAISSVISVFAAVAITKYFAGRKQLSYAIMYRHLVDPSIDCVANKISVLFDGKSIYRLMELRFALWNGGNSELRGGDVVSHNGLELVCSDARALGIGEPATSHPSISVNASINDSDNVSIGFNYLNPGDAITLIAFIDLSSSSERDLEQSFLGGDIIGCKRPFADRTRRAAKGPDSYSQPTQYLLFLTYVFAVASMLMGMLLLTIAIVDPIGFNALKSVVLQLTKESSSLYVVAVSLVLFLFIGGYFVHLIARTQAVPQMVAEHFRFQATESRTPPSELSQSDQP